jgi:DNA polymerase III alpha subunit (gram-positive type)
LDNKEKEEALVVMETDQKELEQELEDKNNRITEMKTNQTTQELTIQEFNAQHIVLHNQQKELEKQVDLLRLQNKEYSTAIDAHDASVSNLQKTLDDKIVEHKINTKRTKGIVKDLKKSLMKESKLKNQMEDNMNGMKDKTEAFDALQTTVDRLQLELDEAKHRQSSGGGGGSGGSGGGGGGGGNGNGGSASSPRGNNNDDNGVTAALAGRLEQLLTENVYVKEKIGMLEGIVQDLTNDLGDKRTQMKIMQEQIDAGGSQGNGNRNGNRNNSDNTTITNNGRSKPTTASPPNFNLGSVTMSTPESRKRHSTVADAIDEI